MQLTSVVTGTSHGIGNAIAKKLLNKNYRVYGISRTRSKIDNLNFIWIPGDLTKTSDIKRIVGCIKEQTIHVLVNNAGTAINENVFEYNDKNFQKIFGLNFIAPIKFTLALLPKLDHGTIVNISSLADRFPSGLYGSSKSALNNYFETIAANRPDLKIVSVLPSLVDTPLLRKLHGKNPNFNWAHASTPDQAANFINFILDSPGSLKSGSRMVVVPQTYWHSNYDPEILWLFTANNNKVTKLKETWLSITKRLLNK
jgi:short-subunit dehydrogenase